MLYYKEFKPDKFNTYESSKKETKRLKYKAECDDILTFDIEVSLGWIDDNGNVIPYESGHDEYFFNRLSPVSLCYIWQFSFNDKVYYGRNLEDFKELLNMLPKDIHFIIYVHNLSYEFAFLTNIFKWDDVFARDSHKVIKATPVEYPNLEFRCSLFLTNLSLESWGDEIGIPKLVGDLDYLKLRTPLTPLTDKELGYAERDCIVVYNGIKDYRRQYKHIKNIPLTQTGEVRKVLRRKVRKNKSVENKVLSLVPENTAMYLRQHACFAGGYTHANIIFSGITLKKENGNLPLGYGVSYDFCSSYAAVMVMENCYPMSKFFPEVFSIQGRERYCYLLKVKFTNLEAITNNHYLSSSKLFDVDKNDIHVDNGRIISVKEASCWLTDIDLEIIMKTYTGNVEIIESWAARKGYLPKYMVESVLDFYEKKTKYKGVKGKEDIYKMNKRYVCSVYGCCVQQLLQDDITFDGENWSKSPKTIEAYDEHFKKLRENNFGGRTFCSYAWGVFITAAARRNLWKCMQYKDGERSCDEDTIYSDTDSLKIRDEYDFSWYNKEVDEKMKAACEYHEIPFEKTRPKSQDGTPRPLGYFVREDDWTEFKTLGAKRYVYRSKADGKLHLTVSGINKEAVSCLNDDIENFNEDTVFDKDDDDVKKNYITYITNQKEVVWNKGQDDEFLSTYKSGINMRPTGYSMSIADEYALLLGL